MKLNLKIKKAYKTLARKYHPDVNQEEDAEAKFKERRVGIKVIEGIN